MTIELALDPALELQISAEAKSRGISMDEYVREALTEKARVGRKPRERKLTTLQFLDAMVYHGPIPPEMHNQEITREFIYGDHP